MSKTILRKVPDEDVYYNFEDFIELDKKRFIICGNDDFRSLGDKKLISIVEGTYYDDEVGYDYETLEELKKVTGKVWEETTIRGYSQSDYQTLYYVDEEVDKEEIEMIENFYMGKVSEFEVEEDGDTYHEFVPDDIVWEGKKSICDYLGLNVDSTTIYKDDGYKKVYKYKEIN
ncbi:hypothetical protein [Intestinibacter sp.]|uniref:hypothetical protein n=1 Tax=Intestinibacter sp. TaxID=1965304 RepID=UPI002A766C7D|nr:hypothetical protein [Intestinibacter sp.]MDY2735822.1 hypothetical protein [Intestinibacter sp.]